MDLLRFCHHAFVPIVSIHRAFVPLTSIHHTFVPVVDPSPCLDRTAPDPEFRSSEAGLPLTKPPFGDPTLTKLNLDSLVYLWSLSVIDVALPSANASCVVVP
jgi:hypothetical protein